MTKKEIKDVAKGEDSITDESEQDSKEIEEKEVSLEDQVEDLNDKLLRAQAEVQNVRRVASQEVTRARLFGVESLAREFISVGDSLQRALESCNEGSSIDDIKEGLELTLKNFEVALETAGISPVSPKGEIFDPEKHEAISVIEDSKKEDNTVVEVIQRGFTIQNRILRPAKVVVTKNSSKK